MNIQWDSNKCRHAGVCVQTLPAVFKIEQGRFVIDPDNATEEEIIEVVQKCPSGALSFSKQQ